MLKHQTAVIITVVIPVKNEIDSIGKTLNALFAQSRKADTIIITDGGSTDGTIAYIQSLQPTHPELTLLCLPQAYPGHGRNHSIQHATGGIIACVDAGCFPASSWLAELTEPFADGAEVVLGHVVIDQQSTFQEAVSKVFFPLPEEVNIDAPPWIGGNLAFTKQVWETIGGFPEDQRAAEDFVYWQRIRAAGFHVCYAPDAIIVWDQPEHWRGFFQQQVRYMQWMTKVGHIAVEPVAELALLIIALIAGIIIGPVISIAVLTAPLLYVLLRLYKVRHKLDHWLTPYRTLWVVILLLTKPSARIVGLIKGAVGRIKGL